MLLVIVGVGHVYCLLLIRVMQVRDLHGLLKLIDWFWRLRELTIQSFNRYLFDFNGEIPTRNPL